MKRCKWQVAGKRFAPVGSPQRNLPTVRKNCGNIVTRVFVQEAFEDRGIQVARKELPLCAGHAEHLTKVGVTRWVEVK